MRTLFIIAFCMLLYQTVCAQTADQSKQLKTLAVVCRQYSDSENYKLLSVNAVKGFLISKALHQYKSIILFANYMSKSQRMFNNMDSLEYYSYEMLSAAFEIHSEEDIVTAQGNLADAYYEQGKPDSVKKFQQQMINETKTFKDSSVIITLYTYVADVYTYYNEYEKCLSSYANVLHYHEYHKDTQGIAVALVNIGNNYLQMSNSEKALPYLLRALPMLSYYQYGQVVCSSNIGAAYTNLSKNDSAVFYFKMSTRIAEKINDTFGIYTSYANLAAALVSEKKYDEAEHYLTPLIQYYKKTSEIRGLVDAEETMGEAEAGRKNFKPALTYLKDALAKAQNAHYPERINEMYKQLAHTADSAGLYKDATTYYKAYIASNDSINKESNQKNIAELETKYQTEQKEQQINLLNQKSKTDEANLKAQQNKTAFIIVALILISSTITIYIRYRNRLNQLKKLNEVRNTISRDLHDEIGATLSSINIYSEVAKNKLNNNKDVQVLLQRINDGSLKMMESMSDIVWYVNPKNDVAINTIVKMREYAAPVLEAKQISLEFNSEKKVDNIKFSMQQRQHLYLLFKEAINNIAKYSGANNTFVDIKCLNENIYVTITDNGKGFDLYNHKQGNGLLNIQQRTEFLKGKFNLESECGKGTTISINFPVSL